MTPPRPSRPPKKPTIDAPTFLLHWGLVTTLGLSLATGLRIASDHAESVAGGPARKVLWLLPEGRVIDVHLLASWLVTAIALGYALFLWRSRLAARVRIHRADLRAVDRALRERRLGSSRGAWLAINRVVFTLGFALIGLLAVTGWMLYSVSYIGLGAHAVATIHGVVAWAVVVYALLHVAAVLKARTFWKMFWPRRAHGVAAGTAAALALGFTGAAYMGDRAGYRELYVPHVPTPPVLDGVPGDPAWQAASPVRALTTRGANLPGGETTVEVRAVHDGESIYFLFRWEDPQRSQKMTPLVKTDDGWRVLQSSLEVNDENEYYEDKFAAILSYRPALGSGTVHLGQSLVEGPHYPNPRGLHYTDDGSIVDLWHWKSLRTGGMTPGFVDDNHIGPPLPSAVPRARYTGGYTQDPSGAPHPYVQNWSKVSSELPLDETAVLPLYLPARPEILDRMGTIDLDAGAHDEGTWYMTVDEVVPYHPDLDDYPVGTVLPGIVLEGILEGDRGDVRAEARWEGGFWTLETRRLLDTGSEYDVTFAPDRAVYLWVAVFNHTQTRHSQHLHPIRTVLR